MPRLTRLLIEGTTANGRDSFIWDSDVPGFGVRVGSSGRKTYVIRYRTVHGTSRYHTIARTCDMTPAQARDAARVLFVSIKAGADPSNARAKARAEITVNELFDIWLDTYAVPQCKASTVYQARSLYRRHISRRLGTRKAVTVTASDVQDLHVGLRKSPSVANQVVSMIRSMYRNAVERKILEVNPAAVVKWYRQREKSRVILPDEIARIHSALDDSRFRPEFRRLVKLLFLTGARLSEIRDARMEWVDWESRTLCLPDSKTGRKVIALSASAMELVAEQRGQTWLCPARIGDGHVRSVFAAWKALMRRAGLEREIRIHDIRHTVGSLGHLSGLSQREIAIQLGHSSLKTTERYTKGYSGIERHVADRIAQIMAVT
jgi:integrase